MENRAIIGKQVAASAVSIVSVPIYFKDPTAIRFIVALSAVLHTTEIKFRLQHSGDGGVSWLEVGNQSEIVLGVARTFDATPDESVNATTDAITITSHGLVLGQAVYYSNNAGTAPGGLVHGETYFVIVVDANTIKLAASGLAAFDGNQIDLVDDGAGTGHRLTPTNAEIRMVGWDATDGAQLPIFDLARVVVSTGSSDSLTMRGVFVR